MNDRSSEAGKQGRGGDDVPPSGEAAWFLSDCAANVDAVPPLDPWLASLVQDSMHVDGSVVPRDLMWARIRQQRREGLATTAEREAVMRHVAAHDGNSDVKNHVKNDVKNRVKNPVVNRVKNDVARVRIGITRAVVSRVVAIAATLAIGVAIGRYGTANTIQVAAATADGKPFGAGTSTVAAPEHIAARASHAGEPAVVAMEEHLARTVALLVAVRDGSPDARPVADVTGWARELLGTTRLLLDEPQLRDDRTRRLLQDLELVLVQIIQARGTTAPEARRAPSETMRETNLLPRVRAVVTASITVEESSFRGIAE